jgi:hypothetical protein
MNDSEKLKAIQNILNIDTLPKDNFKSNLYDEHGVSFETSKYGGVKLKAVEELKAEWISQGGQFETVARSMSEWFCFLRPDLELPEDIFNQINSNQERLWFVSGQEVMIDQMIEYRAKYKHQYKIRDNYKWKAPSFHDDEYSLWIRVADQIVNKGDADHKYNFNNHSVLAHGNYSSPLSPHFYTKFLANVPKAIEKLMKGKIEALNFPTNRNR